MIRRVESRAGRVALIILVFLIATLIVSAPVGILGSSNLVWGEDNQYGRVDVPGSKVLHLPGGTVQVSAAIEIPGAGNETATLPLPTDLALTVAPVSGSARPVVTSDIGSSSNANDDLVNTQRRVFSVQVPQDGEYRVTAGGDFLGVGVNPQLWFGHGPPPPGTLVPVIAAGLVLIGCLLGFVVLPRVRGRRLRRAPLSESGLAAPLDTDWPAARGHESASETAAREPRQRAFVAVRPSGRREGGASGDQLERLARLGDLHDRGVLTDAEFAAEKAKIIAEP